MAWQGLLAWADTGPGSPLQTLCAPDLSLPEFWKNDLGRFTPCFIDLAVLGLAHISAALLVCVHLLRVYSNAYSRYKLSKGAGGVLGLQTAVAAVCALVPILELNGQLGQATGAADAGPAPHEYAGAALATCSWLLLSVLLGIELQGRYVPFGRWMVRFGVVLVTSSELVKLRLVVATQPVPEYFLFLYIAYVSLQCLLSLFALLWWPTASQLIIEHEGYIALPDGERRNEEHAGHPYTKAGFFSRLTFAWLSGLMAIGYKGSLSKQQIPTIPQPDQVNVLAQDFDRHWKAELNKRGSPSLGNACWKTVRRLFLFALPCKLVIDLSQFVGPIFLNRLLNVVADVSAPAWEGYMYAGIMFAGTLVGSLADHQHFHLVMRAGSRLNAVLGAKVAAQVLCLAPSARAQFSTGRIYSAIASDAEQLSQLCTNIFALMSAPLRIIGAMYLLYLQLGVAAFATLLCLLVMIPVNIVLVRWSGKLLREVLLITDERTKLEGELVGGIEVVKCSAWEKPFLERITQSRNKELAMLWRLSIISAIQSFVIFSIPTTVPVVTFSTYLFLGNTLTSATAFTALALFNVLRFPVFLLPQMLQIITQARVSLLRIQDILVADTLEAQKPLPAANKGEPAITLKGDFSWDSDGKGVPALADVSLTVPAGQLVAVVGSTGSGKSTLLSAMLRQMQQVYGDAPVIKGKVAFVPQAAFIINATVRDNILFGKPFDPAQYNRCIHAACLDADLRMFAAGDMTELGDKGVNLSGGQRQRVSMARALYSDADVVLLDDPLSALDSKVGRKVFETAIKTQLLQRGATVVLTTNQLQYVQAADKVVFMQGGKVAEQGTYQSLMAAGGAFANMMKEVQVEEDENDTVDAVVVPEEVASGATGDQSKTGASGQLITEEKMAQGSIGGEVLFGYVSFMGGMLVFLYLLCTFALVEILRVATNVWLSLWTGSTDKQDSGAPSSMYYLYVFSGISAVQLVAQLLNMLETPRLFQRAAGALHQQLLNNLLVAPMSFFHTTPLGRIVNRLTKDTSDVDRQLSMNGGMAFRNFLQVISCIALVGWIAPLALPSMVAIMLAFWLLYQYYQASLRQVKRLEAVSRSPVFTSVGEIISGCATIQAFGSGPRLVQRHAQLIDDNLCNIFIGNSLSRWLGVRLEALGNLCTLLAAVVAVEQRGGASSAGLVLSYAMQMTILMSMLLRSTSVVENNFNSVERVLEYTHLPAEGGQPERRQGGVKNTREQADVPSGWPTQGMVEFRQVAMRYRPGLPLVLRGVSFRAAANEKVGIVGRTGAGKSSMIGCLFRLTELEGGAIAIDGINIAKVPLSRLRASMALIPQVPVLFTGTIRLNLSPFGLHNDAELWSVLRRAHLAAVIESWPAGLDTLLQEGGAPLSAGQKQLLALARAQLNPARVLILDEATANVDVETDALIQRTMRTEFKDRTMLAIAHRLHTIIDYDKVLVLDRGLVAEFGSPKELLSNADGVFTSMVDDTGDATAKFLKGVANGKVDLEASIAEFANDGVEKLCTPLLASDPALAPLLNADVPSGQLLQSLAAQLLERSQAVVKKVKAVSSDLAKHAQEDEDSLAAEGLLQDMEGHGAGQGLNRAQKSLLQALELLVQVEQYAKAAEHIAKEHHNPAEARPGHQPSNMGELRARAKSSGPLALTNRKPTAQEDEEMRNVLSDLVKNPISSPMGRGADAGGHGGTNGAAAIDRDGNSAAAAGAQRVGRLTRQASNRLRATSIQETKWRNSSDHL